jgi:uncharacterized protein YdhG (YjbR/CyaY superfamily)
MRPDPRVDAYLAALPAEQRDVLQALRERVAALAPEATELISYGMPAFKLRDRFLLSYAGWKRHCSIYPPSDDLLVRYAAELEGYGRTKGSLHFGNAQPLPEGFLAEFVAQRVAAIESGGR